MRMNFLIFSIFIFVSQIAAVPLSWYRVPNFGFPSETPRYGSLGYFGGTKKLIFYGGYSDKTHICELSGTPGTDLTCNWRQVNTMRNPGERGFTYSGVCESEKIFVIAAGQNSDGKNLNDIWYFSFDDEQWYEVSATGAIPSIRYSGGSGIAMGECEFFLTMGFGDIRTSNSFTFDLRGVTTTRSGEWRQVGRSYNSYDPSGPHARCLNAGTFINKETFTIFGGCLNALGDQLNGGPCPSWDSWYFDLPSGNWYQLPTCLSPRSFVPMSYLPNSNSSAVLYGGLLDSFSGIPTVITNPPPLDEVAILDMSTPEKWFRKKAIPDSMNGLPAWRQDHHMTTGEGVVFMYGGAPQESGPVLPDLWYLYGDYKENEDIGCPQPFFTTAMAHGILMFLAWGLCFQGGFVVARYARFDNSLLFYLHIMLQMTGLFFAVFGFILGFLSGGKPVFPHAIIGIIAMGLALWQPINALYRPEIKKGEKYSILRWLWYFMHMKLGLLTLVLGLVNISLGLFMMIAPLGLWVTWYVLLFLYIIFLIVMETLYWVRYFRRKNEKIN